MKKIYLIFMLFAFVFSANAQTQLTDYKICLDPGHGGHESDDRQTFLAHGVVYWESEGVLEVAKQLRTLLESEGADVKLTREGNTGEAPDDISLSARSTIANNYGADYFHSIHTNGFKGTANYTIILYKGNSNGVTEHAQAEVMSDLMSPIVQDFLKTTKNYSKSDYEFVGYNYGVLRNTNMPATLSEGAFHDFPAEGLRLKSVEHLKNYAWAIAKSFLKFYDKTGFSNGRLGGVVSDPFDSEPINGVTIALKTPVKTAVTTDDNYNGFYGFDLAPGSHTFTVSKEGYESKDVTATVVANEYTELNIDLMYLNGGKPRADFLVTGLPAGANDQIGLNATNSTDPDGTIATYAWDFGDGESGTGVTTNHTYTADGNYDVVLTVTDNDAKTGTITKTVSILTNPPVDPTLLSVLNSGNDVILKWALNPENDAAYKLYVSNSDALDDFTVLIDENTLVAGTTEYTFVDLASQAKGYNFKLSAINAAGESGFSDTYSRVSTSATDAKKVLIVDGLDRKKDAATAVQSFANTYMATLRDAGDVIVSSAANEAIVSGSVNFSDFDIVVWFAGDESTVNHTFDASEQAKVKAYLEAGGNFLVSGAEIAWDLDHKDNGKSFFNNYLKASYIDDGSDGYNPSTGVSSSAFTGVTLNFAQVYAVPYPDEMGAMNGSEVVFKYSNSKNAGVAYKGTFGSSSTEGAVIYLGFPIESVSDKAQIVTFMEKALAYFPETPNAIYDIENMVNVNLYPVPAGEELSIDFNTNIQSATNISIYDFSGKKVYTTTFEKINEANSYKIDVKTLTSGLYILKAQGKEINFSKKFVKK